MIGKHCVSFRGFFKWTIWGNNYWLTMIQYYFNIKGMFWRVLVEFDLFD